MGYFLIMHGDSLIIYSKELMNSGGWNVGYNIEAEVLSGDMVKRYQGFIAINQLSLKEPTGPASAAMMPASSKIPHRVSSDTNLVCDGKLQIRPNGLYFIKLSDDKNKSFYELTVESDLELKLKLLD